MSNSSTGDCAGPRSTLVYLGVFSLLLGLSGAPLSAQPALTDASYILSTGSAGDVLMQFSVHVAALSYSEDIAIAEQTIPGATMMAHNDCSCDFHPEQAVSGTWEFYSVWDWQDGDVWEAFLDWELYAPSVSADTCSVCQSCDSPCTETTWLEYYTTVSDYLGVTFY